MTEPVKRECLRCGETVRGGVEWYCAACRGTDWFQYKPDRLMCDGRICVNCCVCGKCGRKVGQRHLDVCSCPDTEAHWYCPACEVCEGCGQRGCTARIGDVCLYVYEEPDVKCTRAPRGWRCTRNRHYGETPCAAVPTRWTRARYRLRGVRLPR